MSATDSMQGIEPDPDQDTPMTLLERTMNEQRQRIDQVDVNHRGIRSKNTNRAYQPKQREFLNWLQTKGYDIIVTQGKLVHFLSDEVVGRKSQRGDKEISQSTVELYVAAIVNLWTTQVEQKLSTEPNPRGSSVRKLLKTHAAQTAQRNRANLVDRQAGGMNDGYTTEELVMMNEDFLGSPGRAARATKYDLRNRLIVLMSHNFLLRGESIRRAELPDFFVQPMDTPDMTPVRTLVMLMDQGKTNKNGQHRYVSVMRHRDPLLCTFNALAFHLFERFEVNNEPFPDFHSRENWYFKKLIATAASKQHTDAEMSQTGHYTSIKKTFERLGISTTKITHSGRASGTRLLSIGGGADTEIERKGLWRGDSLNVSYLNSIPLQANKIQAGFRGEPGSYYLPRAMVDPPETLRSMIFPQVDGWLARFRERDPEVEADIAAQSFLKILNECRSVILQDAAILRRKFPNLPILRHQVFRHPDFEAFADEVCTAHDAAAEEAPLPLRIMDTVPEIARVLERIGAEASGRSARLEQRISSMEEGQARQEQLLASLVEKSERQEERLANLEEGQARQEQSLASIVAGMMTLSAQMSQVLALASSGQHSQDVQWPNQNGQEHSQDPPLAPPPPQQTDQTDTGARALTLQQSAAPSVHGHAPPRGYLLTPGVVLNAPIVEHEAPVEEPVEEYVMSRTLTTVTDAWLEWKEGLYNRPSVTSLEKRFGVRWRSSGKDKKFYQRRKQLMDIIERRIEEGASERVVVREMEAERKELDMSLDKYRIYKTKKAA